MITLPLSPLIGSQLSSIEFVQDYVQLRFDGPCITAYTTPKIMYGECSWSWSTAGYRDRLCEAIGTIVKEATVAEGQEIAIVFEDESIFAISLRTEDYRGAEAALFQNGSDDWWVW